MVKKWATWIFLSFFFVAKKNSIALQEVENMGKKDQLKIYTNQQNLINFPNYQSMQICNSTAHCLAIVNTIFAT